MPDGLIYDSDAPDDGTQLSIAELRALPSIGKAIPNAPQLTRDTFVFKAKIVDKVPEELREDGAGEKSSGSKLSRWIEKIKNASPAQRAYKAADVEVIEGKYYSIAKDGRIIETNIKRRPMVTKTEMVFGTVDLNYLTNTGQRYGY